jgi:hypothetical protein
MTFAIEKPGGLDRGYLSVGIAMQFRGVIQASVTLGISAALFCSMTPSYAFEGYEHRQIGDAAFFVALSYALRNHDFTMDDDATDFCTLLVPAYREQIDGCKHVQYADTLTYGELAACIDHFKGGPERLISHIEAIKPSLRGRAIFFENKIGKACRDSWTARSSAVANESHFQGDAMTAFELAHLAALGMVFENNDRYLAAVINAGADHYLLDLLAPGHVYVRRADITDASALSAHDLANREGGMFHIAFREEDSEKGSIESLKSFVCNPTGPIGAYLSRTDEFHRKDIHLRNIDRWYGKGVFASGNELQRACARLQNGQKPVRFRGDDFLFEKDADSLAQRLYAVLVQAQSVLDVLRTAKKKLGSDQGETNVVNSFTEIRFDIDCAGPSCQRDNLVFTFDGVNGYFPPQRDWGILDLVTFNSDMLAAPVDAGKDGTFRAGSRSLMLGLGAETSSSVSNSAFGKVSYLTEGWFPVPKNPNSWIVLAYVIQAEPNRYVAFNGNGGEVRYAVGHELLPGVTFAPFYRNILYNRVQGQPESFSRLRLERTGLRVDIGATDLVEAYFSVYRDYSHFFVGGEKISDVNTGISGGITIRGPVWRIWRCVETLPRCISSVF